MADSDSYSMMVGMTFIFNMLLGTGVLTMPLVFSEAGFVVGSITLAALCFISLVNTSYLVESMSIANFIRQSRHLNEQNNELASLLGSCDEECDEGATEGALNSDLIQDNFDLDSDEKVLYGSSGSVATTGVVNVHFRESQPELDNYHDASHSNSVENDVFNCLQNMEPLKRKFNIIEKFEIGNMTEIFLKTWLSKCFFASIILYLFGDMVVYNSMMAKSLRELACTSHSFNCSAPDTYLDSPCWDSWTISRRNAYRMFLIGFNLILGPLTYAKLQKTKIIQILTIILRWMAFISMVGITFKIFIKHEARGEPQAMNFFQIPKLFGVSIYAFMCHHSLPSMITPIKSKRNIFRAISIDYGLALFCYLIISISGIFAFGKVDDVYTLNFQSDKCSSNTTVENPGNIAVFNIFLPTFPIFTLFSSFTVVAISLINNMKVLVNVSEESKYNNLAKYIMPLFAIIPSLTIAFFTEDVGSIVQYVGSYTGTLIQYVFPCLLAYHSRSVMIKQHLLPYLQYKLAKTSSRIDLTKVNLSRVYQTLNPFASPFQSNYWIYGTFIWWIVCLSLVTLDHLRDLLHF